MRLLACCFLAGFMGLAIQAARLFHSSQGLSELTAIDWLVLGAHFTPISAIQFITGKTRQDFSQGFILACMITATLIQWWPLPLLAIFPRVRFQQNVFLFILCYLTIAGLLTIVPALGLMREIIR